MKAEASVEKIYQRKNEHLTLCLDHPVQSIHSPGWERFRFAHQALPELDLEEIVLSTCLFDKPLSAPILLGAITGGTPEAGKINARLAKAAEKTGLGMIVGSQRIALDHPETAPTFRIVREEAPDIPLGANLGASQLRGDGLEDCLKAVAMIEADFLVLHLNPLQEAIQPEGKPRFKGILSKIARLCARLQVPVIVKEVGNGIDPDTAEKLFQAGVAMVDVAGSGGTSWARVEGYRSDPALAEAFLDWGIPTAEAVRRLRGRPLIASGGIRDGVEIAKALALGAHLASLALPLLAPASRSEEEVVLLLERLKRQLRIAMFCAGAKDLASLSNLELERIP